MMGSSCSISEERVRSKQIDLQLKTDHWRESQVLNLPLLGLHGSGKSTVAQQMKLFSLTHEQRLAYRLIIHNIVIIGIKALIDALGVQLPLGHAERVNRITTENNHIIPPSTGLDIKMIWEDSVVQAAFIRHADFELPDYTQYFLDKIDPITAENYLPSNQDILLCPNETTGVIQTDLQFADISLRMIEVVGKGEKKKWVNCFEDAIAVVFCVAVNEYDLFEGYKNKMSLTLKLFEEVCNSAPFQEAGIILLFNKKDIFEEKIQQVDMTCAFPDYRGGRNYHSAMTYIHNQFLDRIPAGRAVYPHFMSSLDPNNALEVVVLNAVRDIILRQILTNAKIK